MTPTASNHLPHPEANALVHARGIPQPLPRLERFGPNGNPRAFSPTALLKALKRRWFLSSFLAILFAGLAAPAAWFLAPQPKDSVKSLLFVRQNPENIVSSIRTGGGGSEFGSFQRMQIAALNSPVILNMALSKCGDVPLLREQIEQVDWLKKNVQADFAMGPEILRISMTGDRSDELKTIVNAVTETYLTEVGNKEQQDRNRRYSNLSELKDKYDTQLRENREKLKTKAASLGGEDRETIRLKHRYAIDLLGQTQSELIRAGKDIRELRTAMDLQSREESAANTEIKVPDKAIEDYIANESEYRKLMQRKTRLDEEISEYSRVLVNADTNVAVLAKKKELETTIKELEALKDSIRPKAREKFLEQRRLEHQFQAMNRAGKIKYLEEYQKTLTKDLDEFQRDVKKYGDGGLVITTLQEDSSQTAVMAQKVEAELEALKIELKAPARVTKLEEATITKAEPLKQRIMYTVVAGILGLGMGLFGVSFWEYRRQRIDCVEEVVNSLGLDLMGTVPGWSRGAFRGYGANMDVEWQNLLQESIDAARTLLLHQAESQSLRVVMITSAVGSEGKTSLSSHLAASLARAGQKTLLLDWDLRNPSAHRLFDVKRTPGLSEVLRGEVQLEDVVVATQAEGLWMIPAGRCDGTSIRALAMGAPKKIIEQLRPHYDFIVVDSSPVLPVADSLLVGQHVDAVIMSVLQDVSQMPHVYAGYQRIIALGIKVLGAVVNGTTDHVYGSRYYYSSYANYQSNVTED